MPVIGNSAYWCGNSHFHFSYCIQFRPKSLLCHYSQILIIVNAENSSELNRSSIHRVFHAWKFHKANFPHIRHKTLRAKLHEKLAVDPLNGKREKPRNGNQSLIDQTNFFPFYVCRSFHHHFSFFFRRFSLLNAKRKRNHAWINGSDWNIDCGLDIIIYHTNRFDFFSVRHSPPPVSWIIPLHTWAGRYHEERFP